MSTEAIEFSLPNAAAGPDPYVLADRPDDVAFVVLFFQRDYYCTECRKQIQRLADHVEAFRERNAEVVSVLPEPLEQAESWQTQYDLPYPLLADAEAAVGDAYEQPVRFGLLGTLSDFFGRMPEVVVVDRRGDAPEVGWQYAGRSTFDRPDVDEVVAAIDDLRDAA